METYAENCAERGPAANDCSFFKRTISASHVLAKDENDKTKLLTVSVSSLAESLLKSEAARVKRKEIGHGTWQVTGNRLRAHIIPLLGDKDARTFAPSDAQHLIDHLGEQDFSSTTISQYLVLLKKILAHGVQIGVLDAVPVFPRMKVRSQARGSFNASEYRLLVAAAHRLRGRAHPVLEGLGPGDRFWIGRDLLTMPEEMPWLIRWMVNTFVRPSDIKCIKNRHIEVVRGKSLYLRMRLPETKRHSQPMVSLRPAVQVYEQMLRHRQAQGLGGADEFLFMPQVKNREHALAVLGFHFQWILAETGLGKGPQGQKRTLYCLRHTAITFRLLYGQGIDMLTLARNARTSVNMVERFYASTLSGEMNVGLLQSRRSRT